MRTKVTLVLLFLNVALFFFIFKFERGWRIESASKEARRRVLGSEAANIQSLKISGPSLAQPISLAKRADGWYLTEPFGWPANLHAVNRIISDLQFLEQVTSFSVADLAKNNQSLADYGLDHPSLVVTFASAIPTTAQGSDGLVTLRLGNKTRDGSLLYLLSPDGERVYVVPRSLAESLVQTLDQLRSETIFSIPVFEVRSFNLTAMPANLRVRLRRDGNRWVFEAPIQQARANKTETELAINDLNKLRVKSFVTAPLPDSSRAANPTLRISLEGNNRSETLLLYSPVSTAAVAATGPAEPDVEYYARMEGKLEGPATLFTVVIPGSPDGRGLKTRLDHAQTELRDLHVLDFDARAVTALTLAAPNQPELTLQSLNSVPPTGDAPAAKTAAAPGDAAWQIVHRSAAQGPQTQPADTKVIQRVLEKLTQLSAKDSKSFLSDAPTSEVLESWGFNRPERVITLTLFQAPPAPPRTLKLELGVGNAGGTSVYARAGGAGSVYEVDAEILRETPVQPLAYRDHLLRELPAGAQITALRLTDAATKAVLFERQITAATGKDDPLQVLLEQLSVLRAKAFVADQFTPTVNVAGEERPWKYQLDATITLGGGAAGPQTSTTTLFFSERTGGTTQLAGSASPEFSGVWELEQKFIDALWTLTYGPRDPGPPPAEPARAMATPATPTPAVTPKT
jgi:Domain of unknown function (DUF4340)